MMSQTKVARMAASAARAHGFTLVELLIVMSLLIVIAAVVTLNLSSNDEKQLDMAAQAVASAVRHARSEAIRLGEPHGVFVNVADQLVKVYRLDNSIEPAVFVYDVNDPLSKRPYEIALGANESGVVIVSSEFKFKDDPAAKNYIGFAGNSGIPQYHSAGKAWLLQAGDIKLSYQGKLQVVHVAAETGRVTIE